MRTKYSKLEFEKLLESLSVTRDEAIKLSEYFDELSQTLVGLQVHFSKYLGNGEVYRMGNKLIIGTRKLVWPNRRRRRAILKARMRCRIR